MFMSKYSIMQPKFHEKLIFAGLVSYTNVADRVPQTGAGDETENP